MSLDNCHSVQVPTSGTNRVNRLLKSLLPEYVAVDARKIDELKSFAVNLATELKFKTQAGWDGDWKGFFENSIKQEQRTDPHFALFLAFLQNFKLAQNDINGLTKKHLDFFYRDVLHLKEKPAEADQAYLIIQLAKATAAYLLPKNSEFKAGKDDTGVEVLFKNLKDESLNKSEISSIKSFFKDENGRIYSSPVANSADGLGAEITTTEGQWNPFGRPKTLFPDSDMSLAVLGFAVSSPTLALEEGLRKITLTLVLPKEEGLLEKLKELHLNSTFRFFLSGEKEWIEATPGFDLQSEEEIEEEALKFLNNAKKWQDIAAIEPQAGPVFDNPEFGKHKPFNGYDIGEVTAKNILARRSTLSGQKFTSLIQVRAIRGVGEDKIEDLKYSFRSQKHEIKDLGDTIELILKCHLISDQDAVVGYDEETLLQKFKTSQPVLKIELANTLQSYAYPLLQGAKVQEVKINVDVSGVENLILQNDLSTLPVGKNIKPFGPRPLPGSSFYIGSHEAFSKKLQIMNLHFNWHGLPGDEDGFEDYYAEYDDFENSSFQVKSYFLDDRSFGDVKSTFRLFKENGALSSSQEYELSSSHFTGLEAEPELEEALQWTPATKRGFLKLSLSHGFGHKEYPKIFAKAVVSQTTEATEDDIPIPNEPYTPELSSVKLDYTAEDTFVPGNHDWDSFFNIGVFGEAIQEQSPSLLVPDYQGEGFLHIGLKNHQIAQSIQMLVHVLDGSGNPEKAVPEVKWDYLADNEWINFEKLDLVLDETNGLIQTGLVGFTMPRAANTSHTILDDGLTWIRASVSENSDAIPDFTQILAQAIKVTFEDKGNDPNRLAVSLPAETIAKLKLSQPQVSKIAQPFASFGGKTPEASEDFYQRVSERLRHKQRAITLWDYEHLVLEEFPEIYQVKVQNHTEYTGNLEEYRALAPRHATVVLVANVQNKNALDPLRPKASVSLISNVQESLSKINSAGVFLHVVNPVYEELQVKTKVKFLAGVDRSLFAKKLEDELKAFLSPWAFEGVESFNFTGNIHGSVILHFIEKLSYVDYLTCFELYHIVKNPIDGSIISKEKVEEAQGSTGISLLGSTGNIDTYGDHIIEILETDDCECEDNEIAATANIVSSEDSDMDEAFPT